MLSSSRLGVLVLSLFALLAAGCSGSSTSSMPGPTPSPTPSPAVVPSNQVALVAHTPNSGFNRLTVTVTVCVPGTTNCHDIPNIMVDTGSVGLRLQGFALPADLILPAKRYLPDGGQLAECELFGGGDAWGMVSLADIKIGGAKASNMAVHVISSDSARQPAECPSGSSTSNGTLGIGITETDCANACIQPAYYGEKLGWHHRFFSCTDTACKGINGAVDATYQLQNPTSILDGGIYNGAVLDLPAIPGDVAAEVTGTLTFGVNVNAASGMSNPTVATLNSSGEVTTTFNGVTFDASYFDSGTQTYSIGSTAFTPCNSLDLYGPFCVAPVQELTASITGGDGVAHDVTFKVGGFPSTGISALAADFGNKTPNFVWGAPFFFGKRVAIVRRGQSVSGMKDSGPLYAWQPTTLQ